MFYKGFSGDIKALPAESYSWFMGNCADIIASKSTFLSLSQ